MAWWSGSSPPGLCRSDWHAWAGHDEISLPHVPGHELAGVVVATGPGVSRWSAGDRVTVPFVEGCGRCAWCRSGNAQVCPDQQQPGFTHWGSFAEYVALHAADTNLVAVPDGVTAEAAASLGCRFATAYRALTGRAGLAAGEWVTVIGAGGVGLSAVMIAKALGARVIAAGWADLEQASATFSAPEDQRVRESIQRARALDPRQAIRTAAREMALLLRLIWRDEAGRRSLRPVRRMMARQDTQ